MEANERAVLSPEGSLVFQRVAVSLEESRSQAALREEYPGTAPDWAPNEEELAAPEPVPRPVFLRHPAVRMDRSAAILLPSADTAAACAVHAGRG